MAELGLAIVGAVDTGLKLSFGLYRLATDLADAGLEIQALGADVSMTCNALNQVHSVLSRARGCRASTAAIDAAQETVTRCKAIFNQMETVYKSLQNDAQGKTGTTARIKWVLKKPRLRLMQQSLQSCVSMLQLMIASLNLSHDIANGSLAPNSAEETRRLSINAGLLLAQQAANQQLEAIEEECQQSTATADDEVFGSPAPDLSQHRRTRSANGGPRVAQNRHSRIVDGAILHELPQPVILERDDRPTSVVLEELLHFPNGRSSLYSSRWSRFSVSTFDDTLDLSRELQQRWTAEPRDDSDAGYSADLSDDSLLENVIRAPVQYPPIPPQRGQNFNHAESAAFHEDTRGPINQQTSALPDETLLLESREASTPTNAAETSPEPPGDTEHGIIATAILINNIPNYFKKFTLARHLTKLDLPVPRTLNFQSADGVFAARAIATYDSPEEATQVINSLNSAELGGNKLQVEYTRTPLTTPDPSAAVYIPAAPPAPTLARGPSGIEIFKSFKVSLDDPCWKVLPAALRKYNIRADWRQYALYIAYGELERSVGLEEKPLELFKELDRAGKKPMFMLRKLANPILTGSLWESGEGAGTGIE